MKKIDNYSFLSKIIHHIALNKMTKENLFDLDCMLNNKKNNDAKPPVYITGLARSGSTLLLDVLYSTGAFTSLTYRDMPFVTGPILWQKLSHSFTKKSKSIERAHGDGMLVDYDSPEAFEEIFWLTFSGSDYVRDDVLLPYSLKNEEILSYRKYIANVLFREKDSKRSRYLAKDNNNLLRITDIKKSFPEAIVIIPFRDPYNQAQSLLKQHKRFLEIHAEDSFSLKYMNWLGHFDFGSNFKPINFSAACLPKNKEELLNIDYWLRYWYEVYFYVFSNYKDQVVFFCYDEFCSNPEASFDKLANVISLDDEHKVLNFQVGGPKKYQITDVNQQILNKSNDLYYKLREIQF